MDALTNCCFIIYLQVIWQVLQMEEKAKMLFFQKLRRRTWIMRSHLILFFQGMLGYDFSNQMHRSQPEKEKLEDFLLVWISFATRFMPLYNYMFCNIPLRSYSL